MPTFIMLTRLATNALRSPRSLEELEKQAMERIRVECPEVDWLKSYADQAMSVPTLPTLSFTTMRCGSYMVIRRPSIGCLMG